MNTTPCRFFRSTKGCFRGEGCSFLHEYEQAQDGAPGPPNDGAYYSGGTGAPLGATRSTIDPRSGGAGSKGTTCRFFLSGSGCRNGSGCPFLHVDTTGTATAFQSEVDPSTMPPYYGSGAHHEENGSMRMEYPQGDCYGLGPMGSSDMAPPSDSTQHHSTYGHQQHLSPSQSPSPAPAPVTVSATKRCHPKPPRRLQIHSNPSKKKHEVISEITPVLTRHIHGPYFAIDVECVATGRGNEDRDVARIAVVDEEERVFFDRYVQPDKDIVSYLTQLTGISESDLIGAPHLPEALIELRGLLPQDSVIVGQSIKKDLDWLGLEKGTDFRELFDVADLFRIPMQLNNGTIRYRSFSLRHVAKHLLGQDIQEADHDPVIDAKYAMKLFKQFRHLHETPPHRDAVYQTLLKTPRTPSFAERFPVIDGVEMRAPRKQNTSPPMREPSGESAH